MATSAPFSPAPSSKPQTDSLLAKLTRFLTRLVQPVVLLGPAGIWLLLLLVIPTVMILELSLIPGFRPGTAPPPYGLDNFLKIFEPPYAPFQVLPFLPPIDLPIYILVILRSVLFAVNTTLLCMLLGFPVAYWIAVMAPKQLQNTLIVSFVLPLWTSSLLRSYAWITILRPSGVLNSVLSTIGLPTLDILNTQSAVLIGMAYNYLPYMVLILYASLERLDKRLLEAAADLGAKPQQTFWKITVPQTLPGIAAGGLLVFITSLGDFVVPDLLDGASSMTMARLVYNQFLGATRNWGFGSSLSMILILAVSISIALLLKYGDRQASDLT